MTIDIAAKAKALVDTVLAEPANDHDIDLVQRQLGRYPRGMVAVGARCVCGRPLDRNHPSGVAQAESLSPPRAI